MLKVDERVYAILTHVAQTHQCSRNMLELCLIYDQTGRDIRDLNLPVHDKYSDALAAVKYASHGKVNHLIYDDRDSVATDEAIKSKTKFDPGSKFTKAELTRSGQAFAAEIQHLFSQPNGVKGHRVGLKPGTMSTVTAIVKKAKKASAMIENTCTYGQVLAATRFYVAQHVESKYKYLRRADYFFEKDGASDLASLVNETTFVHSDAHSATHGTETSSDTLIRGL